MGTNYYYHYNRCLCCKRFDSIHIGKSSKGWSFTFHGTEEIRGYADWLHFFDANEGQIIDEYQRSHTVEAFMDLVASKWGGKSHASLYPDHPLNWLDDDGYSFSGYEFS